MRWFFNLKTLWKLLLGFALVAGIMAFVGYMGISGMGKISDLLTSLYDREMLGLSEIKQANFEVTSLGRAVRQIVLEKDPAGRKNLAQEFDKLDVDFRECLDRFETKIVSEEARGKCEEARQDYALYLPHAREVIKLALAGKSEEALAAIQRLFGPAKKLAGDLVELGQMKEKGGKEAYDQSRDVYASARMQMIGVVCGGCFLALIIGFFIARVISRPLRLTIDVLQALAKGDFTKQMEVHSKDEIGQMAAALNEAIEGIRTALQEVRSVADTVASSSQQLSAASEEISSEAQEQASSLEETASSLEEISATIKHNADNSQQARQLANTAREVADKGGTVVSSAVTAMGEINQASKKIADIITAIDEIAFQTNLLALNAAVEAARAGEQGRGFAVVAAEVRNLAQRSASAAKEIKGLIQDSVRKVENGSELVTRSGQSLQEIVTSVKRVTDIVSEIAAASREQSAGVEQVSKAVAQMDTVVQSNASQTEELSGTAESLTGQAEQLQGLVGRFQLEAGSKGGGPVPAVKKVAPKAVAKPLKKAQKPPAKPEGNGAARDLDLVGVRNGQADEAEAGFEEF